MNTLQKKTLRFAGTMALLTVAMFGTSPAFGQDIVQGRFTLPVQARLGNTVLPPGEYQFSVEALGMAHSVQALPPISSPVLVKMAGVAKGSQTVGIFAIASKQMDSLKANTMDLQADGAGMMIQAMHVDGVALSFAPTNNELGARNSAPTRGVTVAKGRG